MFYFKDLEIFVLFENSFKHIKTIKNYYQEKYKARFSDYRRIDVRIFGFSIDRNVATITVSKQIAVIYKSDLLVSSDYNSIYPLAVAHSVSKWLKIETAKAKNIENSKILCSLFKNGDWKCFYKSGFFRVRYCNPKEIAFLHVRIKENVFNDRKNKYEEINRLGMVI